MPKHYAKRPGNGSQAAVVPGKRALKGTEQQNFKCKQEVWLLAVCLGRSPEGGHSELRKQEDLEVAEQNGMCKCPEV